MPVCDGLTDGRTDGRTHDYSIYRASIASRGRNAAVSCPGSINQLRMTVTHCHEGVGLPRQYRHVVVVFVVFCYVLLLLLLLTVILTMQKQQADLCYDTNDIDIILITTVLLSVLSALARLHKAATID